MAEETSTLGAFGKFLSDIPFSFQADFSGTTSSSQMLTTLEQLQNNRQKLLQQQKQNERQIILDETKESRDRITDLYNAVKEYDKSPTLSRSVIGHYATRAAIKKDPESQKIAREFSASALRDVDTRDMVLYHLGELLKLDDDQLTEAGGDTLVYSLFNKILGDPTKASTEVEKLRGLRDTAKQREAAARALKSTGLSGGEQAALEAIPLSEVGKVLAERSKLSREQLELLQVVLDPKFSSEQKSAYIFSKGGDPKKIPGLIKQLEQDVADYLESKGVSAPFAKPGEISTARKAIQGEKVHIAGAAEREKGRVEREFPLTVDKRRGVLIPKRDQSGRVVGFKAPPIGVSMDDAIKMGAVQLTDKDIEHLDKSESAINIISELDKRSEELITRDKTIPRLIQGGKNTVGALTRISDKAKQYQNFVDGTAEKLGRGFSGAVGVQTERDVIRFKVISPDFFDSNEGRTAKIRFIANAMRLSRDIQLGYVAGDVDLTTARKQLDNILDKTEAAVSRIPKKFKPGKEPTTRESEGRSILEELREAIK